MQVLDAQDAAVPAPAAPGYPQAKPQVDSAPSEDPDFPTCFQHSTCCRIGNWKHEVVWGLGAQFSPSVAPLNITASASQHLSYVSLF